MAKLKNKTRLHCTNCFKANHIVFNFAYLSYQKYFDDEAKTMLVDRMLELSTVPYTTLGSWGKQKGFEDVPVKIEKAIPKEFESEIEKFDGKFSIIRLHKSGIGRIIGKLVNKVFYIFYIDVKGALYKH